MTTTTPSTTPARVFGVLVDPGLLIPQDVSPADTIDSTITRLWDTVRQRLGMNTNSDKPTVQVSLLGGGGTPTFSTLTPKDDPPEYFVLFGMPKSWSYCVEANKENEAASDNLSKPHRTESMHRDTVTLDSLRAELLGKINDQAGDIRDLQSSNTRLLRSNAELQSSITDLKISNVELQSSNTELQSSITDLKISNVELQSSNTELQSTVRSHSRRLDCLNCRSVLDDARSKLARLYNLTYHDVRPTPSNIHILINQIQSLNPGQAIPSTSALFHIFDTSTFSMRAYGNRAAHEAPQEDIVSSVEGVALLEEIYLFTQGRL